MGKASMSARSATKRDSGSVPFTWATMPVSVTWVWCSTPRGELLGHKGHRLVLLERKFRMGMKVAAEGHPLRMKRLRQRLDARLKGHGNRVGLSWDQAV